MELKLLVDSFELNCETENSDVLETEELEMVRSSLTNWYRSHSGQYSYENYKNYDKTVIIEGTSKYVLIYKIELKEVKHCIIPHASGVVADKEYKGLIQFKKGELISFIFSDEFLSWKAPVGELLVLDEEVLDQFGSMSSLHIDFFSNSTLSYSDCENYIVKSDGKINRFLMPVPDENNKVIDDVLKQNWCERGNDDYGIIHVKNQSKLAHSMKEVFKKKGKTEFCPRKILYEDNQGILRNITGQIDGRCTTFWQFKNLFR